MKLQRRSVAVLAIAAALLCLAIAGVVIWRVERALHGSARDLAGKDKLPFSVQALAAQPNPGFEGMPAPAVFKGGAAFDGHFYLSGPAGLFVYSTAPPTPRPARSRRCCRWPPGVCCWGPPSAVCCYTTARRSRAFTRPRTMFT
jgi:hypothetical protein